VGTVGRMSGTDELLAALDGARGRGWRDADLRHALARIGDAETAAVLDDLLAGRPILPSHGSLRLVRLLRRLPSLPVVGTRVGGGPDAVLLERVRNLLAKAESTTFEAEAEALSGKAQELMARHAIDRALVEGGRAGGDVGTSRFLVEDPYAKARFVLLSSVARACGCEAVWMERINVAHVFGFDDDLVGVDVLYTSLLVQASSAVAAAPRPSGRRAPSQVAAFRRAFLTAFAYRVGDRLAEVRSATAVAADAETGGAVLPVLADRAERVRAHLDDVMPDTRRMRSRVSDGAGWDAGHHAGGRATFATQARVPDGPRSLGSGR
jgi:hypothetical protein